eukprot:GILK01010322.1.p1 GENE.GILK01010322.1~~GILK01010322.1.p1  ORF type:complete len:519 (+),score=75.99 GILK01010322.1:94-1650(+)
MASLFSFGKKPLHKRAATTPLTTGPTFPCEGDDGLLDIVPEEDDTSILQPHRDSRTTSVTDRFTSISSISEPEELGLEMLTARMEAKAKEIEALVGQIEQLKLELSHASEPVERTYSLAEKEQTLEVWKQELTYMQQDAAHIMLHSRQSSSIERSSSEAQNEEVPSKRLLQGILDRGIRKFNLNPKKGIQFFLDNEHFERTPIAVAQFLKGESGLNRVKIGLYMGEPDDFNRKVAEAYIRSFDFRNLTLDAALRIFLAGFKLPGEAQKIDRLMESFALHFWNQNPTSFKNSDTVYVLSFSLIMLNTDAHNPGVKKKMSKQEFISNNRGIDQGANLPESYLEELYDNITNNEIKLTEVRDDDGNLFTTPAKEGWLTKQGGRIKTWKKRYFILSGRILHYFKDAEAVEPCGFIPLVNIFVRLLDPMTIEITNSTDLKRGSIKSAKRTSGGALVPGRHTRYVMCAESAEEAKEWCALLSSFEPPHTPSSGSMSTSGTGLSSVSAAAKLTKQQSLPARPSSS